MQMISSEAGFASSLGALNSQWALPAKNIVIDVAFKMSLSYVDIWQLVKIPKKDPPSGSRTATPHSPLHRMSISHPIPKDCAEGACKDIFKILLKQCSY